MLLQFRPEVRGVIRPVEERRKRRGLRRRRGLADEDCVRDCHALFGEVAGVDLKASDT
jgi:hypothetical protein